MGSQDAYGRSPVHHGVREGPCRDGRMVQCEEYHAIIPTFTRIRCGRGKILGCLWKKQSPFQNRLVYVEEGDVTARTCPHGTGPARPERLGLRVRCLVQARVHRLRLQYREQGFQQLQRRLHAWKPLWTWRLPTKINQFSGAIKSHRSFSPTADPSSNASFQDSPIVRFRRP